MILNTPLKTERLVLKNLEPSDATEARLAITDYAFGSLHLNRVDAGIFSSNKGSLKAFLKAGFEIEGRLKKYRKLNDGWEDELLLGKVKI